MGSTESKIDSEERLNTLIIIYIDENMDEFSGSLRERAHSYKHNIVNNFYANKNINNLNSDLHKFKELVERDGTNSILDKNYFKHHIYRMLFHYDGDEYYYQIHMALLKKLNNIVIAE
jgi:hypothetical protein